MIKEKDRMILKQIGLVDNEIQVYLTLLKIGSSDVSTIAKNSGLYRPYVYDTLGRLQKKGLVSVMIKNDKKFFESTPPSHLIEIEKEKLEEITRVVPQLEKFVMLPKQETNVRLYSGKKVLRVIQKDIIKTLLDFGGENLVIGVDEKRFMETDEVVMHQFFKLMKKNNLKERVLVRAGDNYLPASRSTTKYKFLPKEFFEPTSTFIYGNNVAIVLFGEPLYGLVIKSKQLANTYRKQFELLWKLAKIK